MARLCLIAREEKRRVLVEKYAKLRKELKAKGDSEGLQKLPKNSVKSKTS
jgi:small subunit ribosomal protein S14